VNVAPSTRRLWEERARSYAIELLSGPPPFFPGEGPIMSRERAEEVIAGLDLADIAAALCGEGGGALDPDD